MGGPRRAGRGAHGTGGIVERAPSGPNIRSNGLYDHGTYEARLKTADCSSQPNTSLISGFFTYFNDGTDQNGNGIADSSEIDFEWLCAEPNVMWISMWTDYQDSPEAFRRVYLIIDLASGTIRETCYSTTWSCTQSLTGSAAGDDPGNPGLQLGDRVLYLRLYVICHIKYGCWAVTHHNRLCGDRS